MADPTSYDEGPGTGFTDMLENVTYLLHNNMTPSEIQRQNAFVNALTITRNIYVPTIVMIGLAGNFLSLVVFTASQLRHVSSSGYLAALACADNLFLLSLLVTWLDGITPIMFSKEACRFIIFITYMSSFLSVWNVVCFTSERYIAICHPLHAPMIFSKLQEKYVVIIFLVLSALLYNFALWTIETQPYKNRLLCSGNPTFFFLMNIVTWIDTILTMILPFLLILFMNVRIVWRVIRYQRKRESVLQTHKTEKTPALRNKSQMRITRTLLLVSTTFLVLNLPSHVIRLEQLISASNNYNPLHLKLIQEIAQLIYYSNFSVNFFLYAIYGKHFKKSLKMLITNMCRRKKTFSRDRCRSDFNRTSTTSMQAYSR
ncbi:neuropeptides capa receptor-like [Haliotis rufescens]|uniref:neuropeptides capa receptor-like n=1 Tax=Haliotis rufescens TaxID=6454 RepID=UPI001EAFF5B7|nr:neuropeptides capa receptor-like [Haliotis rufescens]